SLRLDRIGVPDRELHRRVFFHAPAAASTAGPARALPGRARVDGRGRPAPGPAAAQVARPHRAGAGAGASPARGPSKPHAVAGRSAPRSSPGPLRVIIRTA